MVEVGSSSNNNNYDCKKKKKESTRTHRETYEKYKQMKSFRMEIA